MKKIDLPYFSKKKDKGNVTEVVSKHDPFDPFPFEAKNAETAILLLQSKEKSILLATVKALSQYASKSTDNIKLLFDLGVVKNVLPIVEHEDVFTRRFVSYNIEIYCFQDIKYN